MNRIENAREPAQLYGHYLPAHNYRLNHKFN